MRAILSALYLLVAKGGGLLLSYVILWLISRDYGLESTGLYGLVTSTLNFAALFAMAGVETWILKNSSNSLFTKKTSLWLGSRIIWPMLLAVIGLLIYAQSREPELKTVLFISTPFVFCIGAFTFLVEHMVSKGMVVGSEFFRSLARPAIVVLWLLVLPGNALWYPLLPTAIALVLSTVFMVRILLASRKLEGNQEHAEPDRKELNGFWMLTILLFMLPNGLIFVVEAYGGLMQTGYITICIKLCQLIGLSLLVVQTLWAPRVSSMGSKEKRDAWKKASLLGTFIGLSISVLLLLFIDDLATFFRLEERAMRTLMLPLMLGQIFLAMGAASYVFLVMSSRVHEALYVALAALVVQVIGFLGWPFSHAPQVYAFSFILWGMGNFIFAARCKWDSE